MDIEARFEKVRTEESNLGNIVTDLMRSQYNTDIAFANCGSFRANVVIPKGPFTLKTIASIFPFDNKIIVKKIPGRIFKKLLENGLSGYPDYDGRWGAVSGTKFEFDPERPAGDRILIDTLKNED